MSHAFDHFVAIDWSGGATERVPGIAIACCSSGNGAPRLDRRAGGWSRGVIVHELRRLARAGTRTLVGLDLSPALPFVDEGAYFPGLPDGPADARGLWRMVDALSADEPHLSASRFADQPGLSAHFRRQQGSITLTGGAYAPGVGRLRAVERLARAQGLPAQSCFNLVGAAQVGKSSLTGMRALNALGGTIPVWPFDPVPATGPLIVEIYTTIAARAAGLRVGRSKVRDGATLAAALAQLGARPGPTPERLDDHSTDALMTAAWMRNAAADPCWWSPVALTPHIAATEGWTFGVA